MDLSQIYKELELRTSRSSGSGGQHVNKTESRVELRFHPASSEGLSDQEKRWFQQSYGHKLSQDGLLIVNSQAERSQHLNRKRAWTKLKELLRKHVRPPKAKRQAGSFKADRRKRLEKKRRHSEKKALRSKINY